LTFYCEEFHLHLGWLKSAFAFRRIPLAGMNFFKLAISQIKALLSLLTLFAERKNVEKITTVKK
jgi:hypothetical protein